MPIDVFGYVARRLNPACFPRIDTHPSYRLSHSDVRSALLEIC